MASLVSASGRSRADRLIAIGEEERKNNRDVKILLRSLYFLFKNSVPHTTKFQDIIQLQIDNDLEA